MVKPLWKAVFIGVPVLLILLEVGLRILAPDPSDSPENYAFQTHPDYLVTLKPDQEKTFVRSEANGGDSIRWKTNGDGYRGDELEKNPRRRVVVYGDSNVLARFSRLENTFTEKLEAYLEDSGWAGVEVVNAGVLGFGPDQSLIRMTGEIERLKPDLVVFHVFADNDFGDLFRNRLLELNDGGDLIPAELPTRIDPVLKPSLVGSLALARALGKVAARLQGHDAEATLNRIRKFVENDYSVYRKKEPRRVSQFMDYYDMDIALDPKAESSQAKIALLGAVLESANRIAAENEAGFLVVVEPSSIDLTDNMPLSHEFLEQFPGYDPRNLSDAVERVCRKHAVPCLNLFAAFRANDPGTLYFKGDSHWNDRGQDLAARETAGFVTREGLSPQGK